VEVSLVDKKVILAILVVVVIGGIAYTWINQLETLPGEKVERTLIIGTTMDIRTDNMFADYYFGIITLLSHDRLFRMDENGSIMSELVEDWEVSEDGVVWTLRLVSNATWHDDKPLTAEDVAFSINYLKEKVPVYKSHLRLVERAEAVDGYTVKVTLKEPWFRLPLNLMVVRVIPKHVWEKVDKPLEYHDEDRNVGSGPFIYEGFDKASGTIMFRTNPEYRLGKPSVDRVVFKLFKNTEAMIMALKKGEVHTVYHYARGIDPVYVPALNESGIKFIIKPNFGVDNNLWFNCKKYPYNVTEFRKAMSFALNYENYVKSIAAGYAMFPNAGWIPPVWAHYKETEKLHTNLSEAMTILDSIGFKDFDGDGWRELPNGSDFTMRILFRTDLPESSRLAELVKRDLESVGIKIDLTPADSPTFRQIVDVERGHEAFISRTTTWGMMMWAGYGTGYIDARNIGWSNVDDPEFQEVVDQMLRTTDEGNMRELVHRLQDIYAEKLYIIPLYWGEIIQPYRSEIEGLSYDPMYGILSKDTWFNVKVGS
jgi:peptide/nickel transport system substrate-binding protein